MGVIAKRVSVFALGAMAACCLLAAAPALAFADSVTVNMASDRNAARAIQAELDKAASKGTAANPYVVTVPRGTYALDRSLKLNSNTTLNLAGVTFKLNANAGCNMLRVGESDDRKTGYYYQNIVVNGGVFDGNKTNSTVMKAAHAKNVAFNNVVFKNARDSHLVEVAGIDGLRFIGCTFQDQTRNNANAAKAMSPEALQIDILNKTHFPTYRAEDLTMKNVVVDRCTFRNVPRGVGSHTGVYNNPMDNIAVTNCTFTGIDTVAIEFYNTVNLKITGNTINSAPRGIAVNSIGEQGMFFSKSIAAEGKTSSRYSSGFVKPSRNQSIVISDNTIISKGKDPHSGFENEAIVVKGTYLTKAMKKTSQMDAIPKGDHFIGGVTVTRNTITTAGHGIRFRDVKYSTIDGNKITYTGSRSGGANYYGVQTIDHCADNAITKNTIAKIKTNGIYVSDNSKAKTIKGNKISSPGKYGIAIDTKSRATVISGNKITSPKQHGIYLRKSSVVAKIDGNTISSPKKYGIFVESSTANAISKNKITKPKDSGIFVKPTSKVKSITGNTVTSGRTRGIAFYSGKSKAVISKNVIKKCKGNAIYIDAKTKKYKIVVKSNKIAGKGAKIASGKVAISGTKKA